MLTLSDIIAIAIACKLWSVAVDILADFIVKRKDSIKNNLAKKPSVDLDKTKYYDKIPTSPPPPRKRGVVDVNVRVK